MKKMMQALLVYNYFVIETAEALTLRSRLKMTENLGYGTFLVESNAQSVFRRILNS